jgi:signal transduction histidine kinase/CheY-like chemotaxis protein
MTAPNSSFAPAAPARLEPLQELTRAQLLPDTVQSLYRQTGVALAGHLLGALVLIALFARAAPTAVLGVWGGFFAFFWLLRLATLIRYQASAHSRRDAEDWLLWWNLGALVFGAAWGAAVWLLYPHGRAHQQAALLLIAYGYCVGAIPLLANQYRIFLGFISLAFVPTILRLVALGGPDDLVLAGVVSLTGLMTALLGRTYRHAFENAIYLKLRTEQLAEQLQAEKAVAEAARSVAEAASRAKTQFFSAASHDLRQPLHAMGLFAEALRAKSRGDDEVTHLVNSINSSVDALEGLFSELLDITKIDTGGVEPQPEHFRLRELFQRLRLQYEPTAFEKGLSMSVRGAGHAVYADPVLVDRVVRNLLSNAIRYTEDGGVLVGARVRGNQVRVQVWDTGVGIPACEQARIFDEFYQVDAGAALAPNQARGLGLGLSIVQRLVRLMEAPLTLSSVPGRGSVFTLELPLGKPPQKAPPSLGAARPRIGLTLEHRRIVVVEDEPAVREGLMLLLRGWGATVEAFESVAHLAAWTAARPPAPDLAIVDYRLPEGRTGLEALQTLRETFGTTLPAILVTGSTMTGHEDESSRHDFHLLIKPVAPNKLRAMIAFKLGLR